MKLFSLLVFLTVSIASCQTKLPQTDIIQINHGSSFGRCQGYCIHQSQITRNWTVKIDIARTDTLNFPRKQDSTKTSASNWENLIQKYNESNFNQLPSTTDCPDCADRGMEWIEIVKNDGTKKKVSFNFHADMGTLNGLLNAIDPERMQ